MHHDVQWFQTILKNTLLCDALKKVNLVITDVDGCLTDGNVYVAEDGNEYKGFSIHDGYGITCAHKVDLLIAFLSGRNSVATHIRAQKLGIPDHLCFTGQDKGKRSALDQIKKSTHIPKDEIIHFGDDLLDQELQKDVRLFCAPINAPFYIQSHADIVVPKVGGDGALRLLLDLIMFVQEKHPAQAMLKNLF